MPFKLPELRDRMIVRGRIHPPPETDPLYRGMYVRSDEAERTFKAFAGVPVYVEHDYSKPPVGRVYRVMRSENSDFIIADLLIDTTPAGFDAMRSVLNKEFMELSIGTNTLVNKHTNERGSEHAPTEISLVRKGAIPDSLVFAVEVGDAYETYADRARSIYTKPHRPPSHPPSHPRLKLSSLMSTAPTQSTPAAPSAAPSVAPPAPVEPPAPVRADRADAVVDEIASIPEEKKRAILARALQEERAEAEAKMQFIRENLMTVLEEVVKNKKVDPAQFKPAFERVEAADDNYVVMGVAASAFADLKTNFAEMEARYKATAAELDKTKGELKTRLDAEAEAASKRTNTTLSDFFSVSFQNSAASAAVPESGNKRQKLADSFQFQFPAFGSAIGADAAAVRSAIAARHSGNAV